MSAVCRLAVLGDPLIFTLSPALHRAGLEAIGWRGESGAIRTPAGALADRLQELAAAGYRGVNLTHPLKPLALDHVRKVSGAARRARSINTVGFDAGGGWGETTDGAGFVDFLRWLGRDAMRERTVLLGSGGAARSLALALTEAGGAAPTVSTRRPEAARAGWSEVPHAGWVAWRSSEERTALAQATLVIHATPLADAEGPAPLGWLPPQALLVDLVYGEATTPWVRAARAAGLNAHDGLGLLVFQARRSLSLWTGHEVPLEALARAVGWPR